ncbi:hypothetical protein LTR66_017640, partial [Elasticomyces elasticus]
MQFVYGWSAQQYSTWIRGVINNHSPDAQKVEVWPSSILEYEINGKRIFGGDYYSFGRASQLQPGENIVNIRLIRDVRAMGGMEIPLIEASMRINTVEDELKVMKNSIIAPEIYDGRIAGLLIGLTLRNTLPYDIFVYNCHDMLEEQPLNIQTLENEVLRLASGQSRPVVLTIIPGTTTPKLSACFGYGRVDKVEKVPPRYLEFSVDLQSRKYGEPHKFTFLHPAGVVSY